MKRYLDDSVQADLGQHLEACHRRHRNHPAPIGFAHAFQAFADRQKCTVQIGCHHIAPEGHICLVGGFACGEAGVGHANLDGSMGRNSRGSVGKYSQIST